MVMFDDNKVSDEVLDLLYDELDDEFEIVCLPDPEVKFFFDKKSRRFYVGYPVHDSEFSFENLLPYILENWNENSRAKPEAILNLKEKNKT